jgi:phenylpropionate dioxygenase-like ring-hydroxylating dioxygenase large terminal subunit
MLSKEDNDILCRVGPGTYMGDLMRQYWIPAVRSDELPSPDCPPLRVRLLGENLIAFRTTSGKVGLVANSCPHRGASLFFGRNEEEGLRCVYHGWKFDVDGNCVDMPSEPAESNFKSKVHAVAYPCRERAGIIWAYMGPREVPPSLPDLEANMVPEGNYTVTVLKRNCNWMQGIEGELDTVHQAFLHNGAVRDVDTTPGSFNYYISRTRDGKFSTLETAHGTSYGCYRPAEDDTYYWRVAHWFFPFFDMNPTGILGREVRFQAYVPVDDEHTLEWGVTARMPQPAIGSEFVGNEPVNTPRGGGGQQGAGNQRLYLPTTSDWLGRFNCVQNAENDYLIDREAQRTWKSYTGIEGIRQQDMAVTDSMGAINPRWKEHLGTTDQLIIRTRRRLITSALALRHDGIIPPGVDEPWVYRQRSGGVILNRNTDWWEGTKDLRERFLPDQPVEAPVTTVS